MQIKPVKVGAAQQVKPVGVKPVASPTPVKAAQPVTQSTPQATSNGDNGYDALFGSGAPATTESPAPAAPQDDKANKKENKKAPKKSADKPKEAQPKKEYTGPRHVKVYGQTLFTEDDPSVSMEDLRKRVVDEFGYDEFSASRTTMSLDENTGIVIPTISFQKKG